jgi:hypothetical protein
VTAGAQPDSASPSRVTIDLFSRRPDFFVQFPTSITERGDRIAGIVSLMGNRENSFPEWIVIKNVNTDKVESTIDLMNYDLLRKIYIDCKNGLSTCVHLDEVKQRVAAANAVLAQDQWRQIPCFYGAMQPERDGPECEPFYEVEVEFEDARLRVSHEGRQLINARKPTWIYRDPSPSCKPHAMTAIRSRAFDPATGILVVGLHFWATIEGCDEPLWDLHPVRLPALRSKPARGRDRGAP